MKVGTLSHNYKKLCIFFVIVFLLLGVARIVDTYSTFNHTSDEPAHIAAGMEWLQEGTYTYELLHPPLARIASAIGLYLDGARLPSGAGKSSDRGSDRRVQMYADGTDLLHQGGEYFYNLSLARSGTLVFFIVACLVVLIWGWQLLGMMGGLVALGLFSTLPPILAHSGLATTDMAVTAWMVASLYVLTLWLEKPTMTLSILLGVCLALTLSSKFSAFLFLPVTVIPVIILVSWNRRNQSRSSKKSFRQYIITAGISVITIFLVVWSVYRFSMADIERISRHPPPYRVIDSVVGTEGLLHDSIYRLIKIPLPAPELIAGIGEVAAKNKSRRTNYLNGEIREKGFALFFPIALSVKSTIPFVILVIAGYAGMLLTIKKQRWQTIVPFVASLTLLLSCIPTSMNMGIRHILPIYPILALCAAFAAVWLWSFGRRWRWGPILVTVLIGWHMLSSALAHPDYLTYFNALAGDKPEKVLSDSDIDWGQDQKRLGEALIKLDVTQVAVCLYGHKSYMRREFPEQIKVTLLQPYERQHGWVAVSVICLETGDNTPPYNQYAWLKSYKPVQSIGRSINIYYISEDSK